MPRVCIEVVVGSPDPNGAGLVCFGSCCRLTTCQSGAFFFVLCGISVCSFGVLGHLSRFKSVLFVTGG